MPRSSICLLSFLFLFPITSWAKWVQDGGSLNVDTNRAAFNPRIVINNSTPIVVWIEPSGAYNQLYAKSWSGSSWVQIGGSINVLANQNANYPSLALYNGAPYVAWNEYASGHDSIYVKHWNGSGWQADGGSLNVNPALNAINPNIAFSGSVPYAVWTESAGISFRINVKHWNGAAWVQDGGSLNIDTGQSAFSPSLAINGSTPYVAWAENSITAVGQIYVRHWDGGNWVSDGGSLNYDTARGAGSPSLAIDNTTPYVAWTETNGTNTQLYVKHWTGSNWVQDGGSLNIDVNRSASYPHLTITAGTPYVAWQESDGTANQIRVKRWNGSQWTSVGASLNLDQTRDASTPSMAFSSGFPYVTWSESNGTRNQIVVKHWITDRVALVEPSYGAVGSTVKIVATGTGFSSPPVGRLIRSGSPTITSSNSVQNGYNSLVWFNLSGAEPGVYDIELTGDGCQSLLKQAVTVLSPITFPLAWRINNLGQAGTATSITSFCGIGIGDADQDNNQELYVSNQEQKLYQYKKNPTWVVTPTALGLAGVAASRLLFLDGDGDQNWEIGVASLNNHAYQLKGSTWADLGAAGVGATKIYGLAKADLDHNGIVEYYTACDNGMVSQFKYNGASWAKIDIPGSPNFQANALIAGDGNNDGDFELYSANVNNNVYQYKYNGTSWDVTVAGNGTAAMTGIAVGDGDNDNQNEVYAACQDGKVYQIRWSGSWNSQPIGTGGPMYAVVVSDGENAGSNQVYAASGDGHVYEFKKTSTWSTIDLQSAGPALYALAVGDADNDGYQEVYALGQNNRVYQYQPYIAATPTVTPTASPTVTATPTVSPTASASATPPGTPTPTATPIPAAADFTGKIVDSKYFFVYPNPTRDVMVRFRFFLKINADVRVTVYTLGGRKVWSREQYHWQGWNEFVWNSTGVANGGYVYLIEASNGGVRETFQKKLALIR